VSDTKDIIGKEKAIQTRLENESKEKLFFGIFLVKNFGHFFLAPGT
jgi:hypothetical protein